MCGFAFWHNPGIINAFAAKMRNNATVAIKKSGKKR